MTARDPVCPYCQAHLDPQVDKCPNCGAPRHERRSSVARHAGLFVGGVAILYGLLRLGLPMRLLLIILIGGALLYVVNQIAKD